MSGWFKRKVRPLLSLLALAIFFLQTFAYAQNSVLCIESDGHVALEASIDGLCKDASEALQLAQASTATSLQEKHHEKCTDIPLTLKAFAHPSQAVKTAYPSAQIALLTDVSVITSYGRTVTHQQMSQPPPLVPRIHQLLSTVVLQI